MGRGTDSQDNSNIVKRPPLHPILRALLWVLRLVLRVVRDERVIKIVLQIAFLVLVVAGIVTLAQNVSSALAKNNLSPNMAFWVNRAGFNIGGAEAYYSPDDSYARAYMVGLENTLRVVLVGLPLTTIVGVFVGVCLLSTNFLIKNIARIYVEVLRNTPLLVQLFAFYFIGVLALPAIRDAIEFPAGNPLIALSNRGVVFPEILPTPRFLLFGVVAVVGLALGYVVHRELSGITERTGRVTRAVPVSLGVVLAVAALGYLAAAAPPAPSTVVVTRDGVDVEIAVSEAAELNLLTPNQRAGISGAPFIVVGPRRQGLRYVTGSSYSSEYIALLLGLVIYTSAFVAEIVRAGIQAVDKGQVEASRALGLSYSKTLTMIILPQALRVIIPPMGNQYLNLAKNSSLAIAISFSDLFQVSNTIINQSGQTVTVFALVMLTYLVMSLTISYIMNTVNARFQLVSRAPSRRSPLAHLLRLFQRAPARR